MKAGEEKTIDLTFPEDYHAKDLAGQPVQFKVKCVEVKEKKVPAIDDEFAKDVSEFETLAEFKEDLKQKIVDRNMAQSEAKFRPGPAGPAVASRWTLNCPRPWWRPRSTA